jgi:predicted short-subunit dehydrogenase-like oxidoreductase (DUF2520 family)
MSRTFAVIGPGKVGTALARLLVGAGYVLIGIAGRTLASAQTACAFAGAGRPATDPPELTGTADLVLIATPDDAIRGVCDQVADAGGFHPGAIVAHCSGALPSTVLARARRAGAHVGSMHPLQTFATAEQAVVLIPGSYCCIEGDAEAVAVLTEAAHALSMTPLSIATEAKPLYHAAAVVASNYLVVLAAAAVKLDETAGIAREDALKSLLPLIKGTVANLGDVGVPIALTGPVERGDVETARGHLSALRAKAPALLPLYKVLGLEAVKVARAKGTLSAERAARLVKLLEE